MAIALPPSSDRWAAVSTGLGSDSPWTTCAARPSLRPSISSTRPVCCTVPIDWATGPVLSSRPFRTLRWTTSIWRDGRILRSRLTRATPRIPRDVTSLALSRRSRTPLRIPTRRLPSPRPVSKPCWVIPPLPSTPRTLATSICTASSSSIPSTVDASPSFRMPSLLTWSLVPVL